MTLHCVPHNVLDQLNVNMFMFQSHRWSSLHSSPKIWLPNFQGVFRFSFLSFFFPFYITISYKIDNKTLFCLTDSPAELSIGWHLYQVSPRHWKWGMIFWNVTQHPTRLNVPHFVLCSDVYDTSTVPLHFQYNYTFAVEEHAAKRTRPSVLTKVAS